MSRQLSRAEKYAVQRALALQLLEKSIITTNDFNRLDALLIKKYRVR